MSLHHSEWSKSIIESFRSSIIQLFMISITLEVLWPYRLPGKCGVAQRSRSLPRKNIQLLRETPPAVHPYQPALDCDRNVEAMMAKKKSLHSCFTVVVEGILTLRGILTPAKELCGHITTFSLKH